MTEEYNTQLNDFEKKVKMDQLRINNHMAEQKQRLEMIDNEKAKLLAVRDEKNQEMSNKTKKTGQILMTIENLYTKCKNFTNVTPGATSQGVRKEPLTRFDNMDGDIGGGQPGDDAGGKDEKKTYTRPKASIG